MVFFFCFSDDDFVTDRNPSKRLSSVCKRRHGAQRVGTPYLENYNYNRINCYSARSFVSITIRMSLRQITSDSLIVETFYIEIINLIVYCSSLINLHNRERRFKFNFYVKKKQCFTRQRSIVRTCDQYRFLPKK